MVLKAGAEALPWRFTELIEFVGLVGRRGCSLEQAWAFVGSRRGSSGCGGRCLHGEGSAGKRSKPREEPGQAAGGGAKRRRLGKAAGTTTGEQSANDTNCPTAWKQLIWKKLLQLADDDAISLSLAEAGGDAKRPPKNMHKLSFAMVEQQGDRIRIVGGSQLRCSALGLLTDDHGLPPDMFDVLELIAAGREEGVDMLKVKELCKSPNKTIEGGKSYSTYSYLVDVLVQYGLVQKTLERKNSTSFNRCFLYKFGKVGNELDPETIYEDAYRKILRFMRRCKGELGLDALVWRDIYLVLDLNSKATFGREEQMRKFISSKWEAGEGLLELAPCHTRRLKSRSREPCKPVALEVQGCYLRDSPREVAGNQEMHDEAQAGSSNANPITGKMGDLGSLLELPYQEYLRILILSRGKHGITLNRLAGLVQVDSKALGRMIAKMCKDEASGIRMGKQFGENKYNPRIMYIFGTDKAREEFEVLYPNCSKPAASSPMEERYKARIETIRKCLKDKSLVNMQDVLGELRARERGVYDGRMDKQSLRRVVKQLRQEGQDIDIKDINFPDKKIKYTVIYRPSRSISEATFKEVAKTFKSLKEVKKEVIEELEAGDGVASGGGGAGDLGSNPSNLLVPRLNSMAEYEELVQRKEKGEDIAMATVTRSSGGAATSKHGVESSEQSNNRQYSIDLRNAIVLALQRGASDTSELEKIRRQVDDDEYFVRHVFAPALMQRVSYFHSWLLRYSKSRREVNGERRFRIQLDEAIQAMPIRIFLRLFCKSSNSFSRNCWSSGMCQRLANALVSGKCVRDIPALRPRSRQAKELSDVLSEIGVLKTETIANAEDEFGKLKIVYTLEVEVFAPSTQNEIHKVSSDSDLRAYYDWLRDKKAPTLREMHPNRRRTWFNVSSWPKNVGPVQEGLAREKNFKSPKKPIEERSSRRKKQTLSRQKAHQGPATGCTKAPTRGSQAPQGKELLSAYFRSLDLRQVANLENPSDLNSAFQRLQATLSKGHCKIRNGVNGVNVAERCTSRYGAKLSPIRCAAYNKAIQTHLALSRQKVPPESLSISHEAHGFVVESFAPFSSIVVTQVLREQDPQYIIYEAEFSDGMSCGQWILKSRVSKLFQASLARIFVEAAAAPYRRFLGSSPEQVSSDVASLLKVDDEAVSGSSLFHALFQIASGVLEAKISYEASDPEDSRGVLAPAANGDSQGQQAPKIPVSHFWSHEPKYHINVHLKHGAVRPPPARSRSSSVSPSRDKAFKRAFDLVQKAGEEGLSREGISDKTVRQLVETKEVYLVPAYNEHLLVPKEAADPWLIKNQKTGELVVARKWTQLDGAEDVEFHGQIRRRLALCICENPALGLEHLYDLLYPVLDPVDVDDVLDELVEEGVLERAPEFLGRGYRLTPSALSDGSFARVLANKTEG